MRFLVNVLVIGATLLVSAQSSRGQATGGTLGRPQTVEPITAAKDQRTIVRVGLEESAVAVQDDKLKKQVDLLQKQIETQQKMIDLLADHIKKQPILGSPVEKLQQQVTTLDARSKQAAQRDQDLSQAIDNITEHVDAEGRNGPRLPSTLKEMFLPSRTNQTPLSIYGTLVAGYELFPSQKGAGRFVFDGFETIFLMQLNDRILLEAQLEYGLEGVELGYGQMDYIVNDWLTVVAGRYLTPIGFFNERLHAAWINKLPDFPLMQRQVSPGDSSLNGLQLRGAKYLFGSPVKMEYALFVANGLGIPENELTPLANLNELKETTTRGNDAIAFGGRVGFWVPELGFNCGASTLFNRAYRSDAGPFISLWGIDAGYHKGNWDIRFEYANMFQKSPPLPLEEGVEGGEEGVAPANPLRIRRRGFYAQVAYRPYDAPSRILSNTEFVFRYSRARFGGFDQNALELDEFASPVDAPVDRNQYTIGLNYYFAPSLVIKFAYEINREQGMNLRDNVFLTQLAWGF